MTASKSWLVVGASRGFGRLWAEAALARGDAVAATARDPKALADLAVRYGDSFLPLTLDVTERDKVFEAVNRAHRHFGKLDVVMSVAGYGFMGALEEAKIEDIRAVFETNVIGTMSVMQAAIPLLRAQGSGHIIPISSFVGLVGSPIAGVYGATKFAVEGLGELLAAEVAEFGIKVTIVEPGGYATDFMSASSLRLASPISAYSGARERLSARLSPDMMADPHATVDAILKLVDAEQPPLRLILGGLTPVVEQVYQQRLDTWRAWRDVADAAQGGRH